jgi:hypothetical protein
MIDERTTLILAQLDDVHALAVAEYLPSYVFIDDKTIENNLTITTDLDSETAVYIDGKPLNVTSVFWRNLDIYPFDLTKHFCNSIGYMKLFLESFREANWVNPLLPFISHYTKVDQFRSLDILKPQTLITNNLFDARKFISMFDSVAAKPVAGGSYTKRYWKPSKLKKLNEPMTFQEYIPGTNIRSFVIGNKVYSAEITTDNDDFRIDGNFTYTPIKLSRDEKQLALDITSTLGYKWTAIDWIRYNDDLYFLEANFSPCFLFFEEQTGYPITASLAKLLIQ